MSSPSLLSHLSSLSFSSPHPLLSCIVTVHLMILIYLPRLFFKITLSPVFVITQILFFSLLRLGSVRRSEPEGDEASAGACGDREDEAREKSRQLDLRSASHLDPGFGHNFVEWNVRAPLEVIYEAHEDEEGDQLEPAGEGDQSTRFAGIERLPSLSLCYPETDTDSDSDSDWEAHLPAIGDYWFSPARRSCMEAEDREELIEIALDHPDDDDDRCRPKKVDELDDLQGEEENMIEIDIFSPVERHRA